MLLKKSRLQILLFFLSCSVSVSAQQDSVTGEHGVVLKKITEYVDVFYERKAVPSITVAMTRDGNLVLREQRGYADVENLIDIHQGSVYRIASISKLITAALVLKLVEKGSVSLDEDIREYIPYLPKFKEKVTLRRILSHTSGLRSYKGSEFNSTTKFATNREVMEYLKNDTLEYKPGAKYLYSTLAYNYIAAALEYATGNSFEQLLQENVFLPMQMNNTFFDRQERIVQGRTKGYIRNDYRELNNAQLADLSLKFPGGGIISTADDLLKFGNGLINGTLLSPALLDTLRTPAKLNDGTILPYGLGMSLDSDSKGRRINSHSGGGTGFVSHLLIYPAEKLVTVHLINLVDRNLGSPGRDIAQIFLGDSIALPRKSIADTLMFVYRNSDIQAALKTSFLIRRFNDVVFTTDLEDYKLFGYDLIKIAKIADAVLVFNDMLREEPSNKSAYIGLGDAYSKDNNTGLAVKNYKHALKLDPQNKYVLSRLNILEKKR